MSFYYLLKLYKLLKCICRNQFSMFFQICFSRDCESLAASIFRKDIAYSVKIFRRSLRLMENKKISFIFSIPVQSILACKESVQSMSCSNYIIQPGKTNRRITLTAGVSCSGFSSADFLSSAEFFLDSVFSLDSQSF